MMLRILLAASLALLPVVPLAAAHETCVTTSTGIRACGSANAECGVGTATGSARAVVAWKLVVESDFEESSSTLTGTAAVLAASAVCRIPGCTTATLYADGTLVDTHSHCKK